MKQFDQYFTEMYVVPPGEKRINFYFIVATNKKTGEKFLLSKKYNPKAKRYAPIFTPFSGRFLKKDATSENDLDLVSPWQKQYTTFNIEIIKKELPYHKRKPSDDFRSFLVKAYQMLLPQIPHQWVYAAGITIPPALNKLYRHHYRNMKGMSMYGPARGVHNDIDSYGDRKLRLLRSLTRLKAVEMKKDDKGRWVIRTIDHEKLLRSQKPDEQETGYDVASMVF